VTIASIYSGKESVMGQASVLNESEIRRVFRIIETTRHVERNRLCFVLSLYSGLRVGEVAALTIGDVATQNGDVRREIKLGVHQTKGSKGRTVILSERVGWHENQKLLGHRNIGTTALYCEVSDAMMRNAVELV
jgi:site-specific recombinase XerD